jgi:hypothetical protein
MLPNVAGFGWTHECHSRLDGRCVIRMFSAVVMNELVVP